MTDTNNKRSLSSGSQGHSRRCSKRKKTSCRSAQFFSSGSTIDFNSTDKTTGGIDSARQNLVASVQTKESCKGSDSGGQEDKFYVLERKSKEHTKEGTNHTFENENGKEGISNGVDYIVPSTKICIFCHNGDLPGESWLPNPLIVRTTKDTTYTQWVHVNCAAFSSQVYTNATGTVWYNILRDVRRSRSLRCSLCGLKGASMTCYNKRCRSTVHITCAQSTAQKWKPIIMTDPSDPCDMWHCDAHYAELKESLSVSNDFGLGRERWAIRLYDRCSPVKALLDGVETKSENITIAGNVYSQIKSGVDDLASFDYITRNIYGNRVNPIRSIRHLKFCRCIDCDESDFCDCKFRRLYLAPKHVHYGTRANCFDSRREIIMRNNIFRFTCNPNCRCNVTTCSCRPKICGAKLMLGKYPIYRSGNDRPDCGGSRIEEEEKPCRIRKNSIGVFTENAISAGEYIIELVGQIVDDEYLQNHPTSDTSSEEYGFVFNLQKCCNISHWRDPSDFSVYDDDDDDVSSVTDESSDYESHVGSEEDESDMDDDADHAPSTINQSSTSFTLDKNSVNIKRNDSYGSSTSTVSTDTAFGNTRLQSSDSAEKGNASYRSPEDIILKDILNSIVDEIEEVSRIIARYESAERFEMLERKLKHARNKEDKSNIQNGEPSISSTGLDTDHALSESTVARVLTTSNGIETIPVVSSSNTVNWAGSSYRPIRAYRTLRASEVFLPLSATRSSATDAENGELDNMYVQFFSLEEVKDLFRIRGNLKDNKVEIDEIIDENAEIPDGIKVGHELLAIGNLRAYPSMTDRFSKLLITKTKYDKHVEEDIPNPDQVLVQIGHRVKQEKIENWHLDSRREGNISRFMRYVASNSEDKLKEVNAAIDVVYANDSCPRIFLVSTRRIEVGEEIVFRF